MKTINSISPSVRDNLLLQNIGKYNQIERIPINPIGVMVDIYKDVDVKKESTSPNGLLEYYSKTTIDKNGELEETLKLPNSFIRNNSSIDITYDNPSSQKYSYIEGSEYHDPKDKNWMTVGLNAVVSYAMGDSVGVSYSSEGFNVVSTGLELSTNLLSRTVETIAGDSNLSKIGLTNLGISFANTLALKSRMISNISDFFEKPVDFYNNLDQIELENIKGISTSIAGFSDSMIPVYNLSSIKEDTYIPSNISDITNQDLSWINGNDPVLIDESSSIQTSFSFNNSSGSLLSKTQKMFKSGRIQTMTSNLSNLDVNGTINLNGAKVTPKSRGLLSKDNSTFCRVFTSANQYNKISNLIRPLGEENLSNLNKTLSKVRPGLNALETHGVLQKDGFVKITPYQDDDFTKSNDASKPDTKKYMFSIENLAWKGSIDSLIENTSQEGPNGGRIMWFPPYDINFNETTSVNWNSDNFIGRGEPVYTYTNTERGGTLNFKLIVDHPSIINYYKQSEFDINGNKIENEDYLRFFAGCDVLELSGITQNEPDIKPSVVNTSTNKPKNIKFKVFFPNNYSGVNDGYENALLYLNEGELCSFTGGLGYEMYTGLGAGLTPVGSSPCNGNYYYRADTAQILKGNQYKDTISFGLNSSKFNTSDPDVYSFKEAYNFIKNPDASDNEDYLSKSARLNYVQQYVFVNSNYIEMIKNYTFNIVDNTTESLQNYEDSKNNYDSTNEELNNLKINDEKYNPGGFVSVSTITTDDSGIKNQTSDKLNSIVSSNWSMYTNQQKIVYYNLDDYMSKYLIWQTEANGLSAGTQYNDYIKSMNNYEISKNILDGYEDKLNSSVQDLYNSATYNAYNDFYQILLDAKNIAIVGSASKHGIETENTNLTNNRIKTIKDWLKTINNNENIYKTKSAYSESPILPDKDTSSKEAKSDRFAYVIITTDATPIDIEKKVNEIGYTTIVNKSKTITGSTENKPFRVKKSMYGYFYDKNGNNSPDSKLYNDESKFFQKLGKNGDSDSKFIIEKLSEKIKYFHPAFHSTTPEGFNSRLTFLHQCTRQGPTSEASNSNGKRSATNMAFGRPPVCVLRIGDFYNTKVIFESLNINYEPLVWDLNQEGIGVQPMIADISMNFKFIGGSDLTGPIARLQNAITFNFFANTGVYDDRNDKIISHKYSSSSRDNTSGDYTDTYETLYNPFIYDSNVKTLINTTEENNSNTGVKNDVISWVTTAYTYQIINEGNEKYITATDKKGVVVYVSKKVSNNVLDNSLYLNAKTLLKDM